MKKVRIALSGVPSDYKISLLPLLISNLGYQIEWVNLKGADLHIIGSFMRAPSKPYRWLPKPLRKIPFALQGGRAAEQSQSAAGPLRLFHTGENLRHNHEPADYEISHDLGVSASNHFRLPYWMEMVDWSDQGLTGNTNPRYGQLLSLKRLQAPLGSDFIQRQQHAAIVTSHLREPRAMCIRALQNIVKVDGFGPYFDSKIRDHHSSHFVKAQLLREYAFNLCPENGLYPGYYTEKIPEAFQAGCLPITFADTNIVIDFNPKAMINLIDHVADNFERLQELISSPQSLQSFSEQPLMLSQPNLDPFRQFVHEMVRTAVS
jgi:hypothetical protein